LVLYGVYQDSVEIVKFSEYEIVKLDDATFSKKYINEYSTSHFKVESWFEVLEFNLDYTIPYFDKNICGVYDAFYVSYRENGTTININTNIIIKPYTNFIDGGVYNKGKVLEFLGYAKINNTGIYYGTSLEQTGEYIIEIIDCNLNSTFYKLKIVDDYYYKQNDDFIPSDIYINYNESASLRFYVKNHHTIPHRQNAGRKTISELEDFCREHPDIDKIQCNDDDSQLNSSDAFNEEPKQSVVAPFDFPELTLEDKQWGWSYYETHGHFPAVSYVLSYITCESVFGDGRYFLHSRLVFSVVVYIFVPCPTN
jgi:hypothetical protein